MADPSRQSSRYKVYGRALLCLITPSRQGPVAGPFESTDKLHRLEPPRHISELTQSVPQVVECFGSRASATWGPDGRA